MRRKNDKNLEIRAFFIKTGGIFSKTAQMQNVILSLFPHILRSWY